MIKSYIELKGVEMIQPEQNLNCFNYRFNNQSCPSLKTTLIWNLKGKANK